MTTSFSEEEVSVIDQLYDTGCLKFGKYILRSGKEAPYYIDLRILPLKRQLIKPLCKLVSDRFLSSLQDRKNVVLSGVPQGALPLAQAISDETDLPNLFVRKEEKAYGNQDSLYSGMDTSCMEIVIIDDVISTGHSIQEMIDLLKRRHLKIKSAIVIVEREQNGLDILKSNNKDITFSHLFSISDILESLKNSGRLSDEIVKKTLHWIDENKIPTS